MALVIAVANQKGGAGKTTTAEQLAVQLVTVGYRLHALDLDPQASFTRWARQRRQHAVPQFTVGTVQVGLLHEELREYQTRSDLDIVLIDCPGNIEDITLKAVQYSDVVVCPVRATALDIEATKSMAMFIRSTRASNPTLKFVVFHNAKHAARTLDKEAGESLTRIFSSDSGTFILSTAIADTAAVAEAGMTGLSVGEYAPKSQSARQYTKLTKEILQCLK